MRLERIDAAESAMPAALERSKTTGPAVIGVGLGRTGTFSLQRALEILGFTPCYHVYSAIYENPRSSALWMRCAAGEAIDFDRIFDRYRSVALVPVSERWKDVVDHYPEAKVILTVRDLDAWYDSTLKTLYRGAHDWGAKLLSLCNPVAARQRRLVIEHEIPYMELGREGAKRYVAERNEAIRKHLATDRLLVYEVAQGWAPLCRFLGVAVPDQEFPHLNDKEAVRRKIIGIRVIGVAILASLAALAGAGLWIAA